ncbi:hypothetical protein DB346_19660 [Verrucomicrobia bacterium LW23]|nr:hypothetical protein DB346_19660 [Verrucomicrobia bacterium LW23]
MHTSALLSPPAGVAETLELIHGFDACLASGLGRLNHDDSHALEQFLLALEASPFAQPLREAREQIEGHEVKPAGALALAAGRAALLGALHDALAAHLAEALQVPVAPDPDIAPLFRAPAAAEAAALQAAQQWLLELAMHGWRNLGEAEVAPFALTLTRLLESPGLQRAHLILDGFWRELCAQVPLSQHAVPQTRWADLWTRSLLLTRLLPPGATAAVGQDVRGTLTPLGAEVRSHAGFARFSLTAVLACEREEKPRLVRVEWQAYKVDLIDGSEICRLFHPTIDPFLTALAEGRALGVTGKLDADGRLRPAAAVMANPADPAAALKAWLALAEPLPRAEPFDRHPLHLRYPALVEGPVVADLELNRDGAGEGDDLHVEIGGHRFPLTFLFHPRWSELNPRAVATATSLIGFWRFERNGWCIQPLLAFARPLAAQPPKSAADRKAEGALPPRWISTACRAWEQLRASKSTTMETLRERASKMLRA